MFIALVPPSTDWNRAICNWFACAANHDSTGPSTGVHAAAHGDARGGLHGRRRVGCFRGKRWRPSAAWWPSPSSARAPSKNSAAPRPPAKASNCAPCCSIRSRMSFAVRSPPSKRRSRRCSAALVSPNHSPEERQELLTIINEESDRLNRLIGEAAEMAQLDANKVEFRFVSAPSSALWSRKRSTT
jgi:hypothetical protein